MRKFYRFWGWVYAIAAVGLFLGAAATDGDEELALAMVLSAIAGGCCPNGAFGLSNLLVAWRP